MTRRLRLLALSLAIAVLAAGCGEDLQQQRARELLQAHLAPDRRYAGDDAHCTDAAKSAYFVQRRTYDFICAVRRVGGGCDWWRVELVSETSGRFARYRDDAGCTLPV